MNLVASSSFIEYGEAVEKYIIMLKYIDKQPIEKQNLIKIELITQKFKHTVNVFSKENQ